MKKFKFWCRGTSTNPNFNKPGWWNYPNYLLQKYFTGLHIFESPYFEVCQWTGCVDRNGIEIYEGDILMIKNYGLSSFNSVVELSGFSFVVRTPFETNGFMWMDTYEKFEIIGNKFENPELLQ